MLAKQPSDLGNADSTGIVLCAKMPVILTSRAGSVAARLASIGFSWLPASASRQGVA